MTEEVGAIVVATGFELYTIGRDQPEGLKGYGEYGYGKIPDVIDGLQFERLASATGPTGGEILRPSDGKEPKTVVFIQCVGSRDPEKGMCYCSKICCMYTAKHTMLYKHKVHDGQAFVFYMDIRAAGKGYDEFSRRAIEEDDADYIRGRVSRIFRDGDKIMVWGIDTLSASRSRSTPTWSCWPRPCARRTASTSWPRSSASAYDEVRLHQRGPPQAAPGGDQHRRRLPGRRLPGAEGHPGHGRQASAAGAKVLGLFSSRRAGARADRGRRQRADLRRLLALRAGLPLRRHRGERDLRPSTATSAATPPT